MLEGKKLHKSFSDKNGQILAVNNVSFSLEEGEFLGIVGESGSGKSTLLRMMAGLEEVDGGNLYYQHTDYTGDAAKNTGRFLQMIFQDAYASFDPRMKMRDSVMEGVKRKNLKDTSEEKEVEKRLLDLMSGLGLDDSLLEKRPKELSGGQCQRMSILRALLSGAKILLCDEITSALDVVTQNQICKLLQRIGRESNVSIIFVSHDIALVSKFCTKMLVMHEGQVVEEGSTSDVIASPKHPYTRQLISCSRGLSL